MIEIHDERQQMKCCRHESFFYSKVFSCFQKQENFIKWKREGGNFKVNFGNYYYKIIKDNPPSDLAITNKPITKDFQIANH